MLGHPWGIVTGQGISSAPSRDTSPPAASRIDGLIYDHRKSNCERHGWRRQLRRAMRCPHH